MNKIKIIAVILLCINLNSNHVLSKEKKEFKDWYGLGGLYFFPNQNINKINFKYYKNSKRKYHSSHVTVGCITKGSPAELAGLKLYDQIVSVNNNNKITLQFLKKQKINLKIIRDSKLLHITVELIKNESLNKEMYCTEEFKHFECNTILFDKKFDNNTVWPELYKCYKLKKANIIPFFKHDYLMLNSFRWTFSDAVWKDKNPETISSYIEDANKYLNILSAYLSKERDTFDEKKFMEVQNDLDSIEKLITHAYRFVNDEQLKKSKRKLSIDKNSIERIKVKIQNIENFNDKKNLNFLIDYFYFLLKANEDEFLKKYWRKAVEKINWNNINNLKYFEIYFNYSEIFGKSDPYNNYIINNEIEKFLNKYDKNNLDVLIKFRYLYTNSYFALTSYNAITGKGLKEIKKNTKKLENIFSLYKKLNSKDKEYVRKNDRNFFYNGYLALSTSYLYLDDRKKLIEYSKLAISEIDSDNRFSQDSKITFITQMFDAYIALNKREEAINSMYQYKNILSKVINTRSGQRSVSYGAPYLSYQLYNLGMYQESWNLVKFIDDNINLKKAVRSDWVTGLNTDIFNLTKALLYKNNNEYEKAIKVLKPIYKKCKIKTPKPNEYWACLAFMQLLENYYLSGEIFLFEQLFQEILGVHPRDESYKNLITYAQTSQADQVAGLYYVFLNYYYDNNKELYNKLAKYSFKLVSKSLNRKVPKGIILSKNDLFKGYVRLANLLYSKNEIKLSLKIYNLIRPQIIKEYQNEIYNSYISPRYKPRQIIKSYFDVSYKENRQIFTEESYELYQVLKNSKTAREIKKSKIRKKLKNTRDKSYQLVKKIQDTETELASYFKKDEYDYVERAKQGLLDKKIYLNDFEKEEKLRYNLSNLIKEVSTRYPSYKKEIQYKPVRVSSIKSRLSQDEAVIDYFFDENFVYIFLIKKDFFKIYKINFLKKDQVNIYKNIRKSLEVEGGKLKKFNLSASYKLYEKVFKPLENNLDQIKKIYVVSDGLLQKIPLNVLITSKTNNTCTNCQDENWLIYKFNFIYLPSIDFLTNKKFQILDNSKKFLKDKVQILDKKSKNIITKSLSNVIEKSYIGIGDPDLDLKNKKKNFDNRLNFAKIFSRGGIVANSKSIRELYDNVDGSSDEIKTVSNLFFPKKIKLLLGPEAKETTLKKIKLEKYDIIHFATHGELSGALDGYNEPFLVLSPPDKGNDFDDGILTMTEIMQMEIKSDLVILSACNTAAGEDKTSEGYSGLAKAFIFSGTKSLLVSNWYVETYAAKELIINFMKNMINHNKRASSSLNTTMINFIKSNPEKSHPFYWAPFIVVGKNISL